MAIQPIPKNRYLVFALIASLGLFSDLYCKHLVFTDLGYPAGAPVPTADGVHQIFSAPQTLQGQSENYLTGWVSFQLYTSFNRGALWGIGQNFTWIFASLSILAALGLLYWLFVCGAARSMWLTICLSLIFSGTLGNLYDRLGWHGYLDAPNGEPLIAVRDFMLFTFGTYHWPIFNFADVFLVTGAIMLAIHSFQANATQLTERAKKT